MTMGNRSALKAGSIVFAMCGSFAAGAAGAQTSAPATDRPVRSDDATRGGDIVVTATRRSTKLQETPLAVTAVTGETLANAGVTNSADLARIAPNLAIRDNATGVGSRLIVRNIQASGEPIVGLYYDDSPVVSTSGTGGDAGSSTPSVRLFDVERVEVLRGPQGTLFGASSMAGAVRLIFAKPDLDRFGGAFSGNLTSVAHGSEGGEANAMINAPLIEGKLGLRAVGFYSETPGYVDNPLLGRKDVNRVRSKGGRLMLRAAPSETLTIDLSGVHQETTGEKNTWLYTNAVGRTPDYQAPFGTRQPQGDKLTLVSGTANWDAGLATVTANLSFERRSSFYTLDVSRFFSDFAAAIPSLAPLLLSQTPSASYVPSLTKNYTQELRASSNGDGVFGYTLGFYHSIREGSLTSSVVTADPATGILNMPQTFVPRQMGSTLIPANTIYHRNVEERLEQTAGFGEISLRPIDRLTLTAGARYYDYRQRVGSGVDIGQVLLADPTPFSVARSSNNGWVLKFGADYKVTPDIMVYASASQGFRPGGVNQVVGLPAEYAPFSPDKLWDYEVGVKSSLFDHKLILNADVFQIDWNNIQVQGNTPAGTSSFISNAGAARARGIEIEATARPIDGLTLQANGSYTDSKLTKDQISDIVVARGRKGDLIPYTSKWTAQASVQYEQPLNDSINGIVRADVSYNSASWSMFQRTDRLHQRLPGYAQVGTRVGIESSDSSWGAYLFARNLFDKVGLNYAETLVLYGLPNGRFVRAQSIAPRTIGLEVRKTF